MEHHTKNVFHHFLTFLFWSELKSAFAEQIFTRTILESDKECIVEGKTLVKYHNSLACLLLMMPSFRIFWTPKATNAFVIRQFLPRMDCSCRYRYDFYKLPSRTDWILSRFARLIKLGFWRTYSRWLTNFLFFAKMGKRRILSLLYLFN